MSTRLAARVEALERDQEALRATVNAFIARRAQRRHDPARLASAIARTFGSRAFTVADLRRVAALDAEFGATLAALGLQHSARRLGAALRQWHRAADGPYQLIFVKRSAGRRWWCLSVRQTPSL